MKRMVIFIATAGFALSTSAQALKVDSFALGGLHLVGRYCQFGAQHNTLLASDWSGKFWMKIDGKMVEFQSQRNDVEMENQLKNRRWLETLKADGVSIHLDLVETGRGDDSAAFRGHVDVQRSSARKRLLVTGGCGA
jgi:elongation factor P hydroxylase